MNTANKPIPTTGSESSNASVGKKYVELNLTPEEIADFHLRFVCAVNQFRADGMTKAAAIGFYCNPFVACTDDYEGFVVDMTGIYDGHARAVKVAA